MSAVANVCLEVARVGPSVCYHPEPDKMWGICPRHDEVAIRAQFAAKGFPIKLCRGRSSWAAMLEVRR